MTDAGTPIYTIGYGNAGADAFFARLATHAVEFLIDVRSEPYSRFAPEFSRDVLEAMTVRRGLRYVFMGDAVGGRPADPTCYVDDAVDYDLVAERPWFLAGLERLRTARERGHRVALMCAELDAERCHRTRLVGRALVRLGIPVLHIERDGTLAEQAVVMARITGGQADLFGTDRS